MLEKDILHQLEQMFPSKIIYLEQRWQSVFIKVRQISRQSGISSDDWLASQGFFCSETGYVEPDMEFQKHEKETNEAFDLADWILKTYPLVGEYEPTDEEKILLYQSAQETAQAYLTPHGRVTQKSQVVLFVATIQMLKTWKQTVGTEDESTTFWNDIYAYYGIKAENHSEQQIIKLYASFRKATKDTLMRYKRFFAPEQTMRYYTTLLLHAFAPKPSMEALFRILFNFYAKELDFQYFSNDVAYKTFVKGMRARWEKDKKSSVHIKSDAVNSGLRMLFTNRAGYMAVLSDQIVQKMDALLRGESSSFSQNHYLDILLEEWYQKLSSTEKTDFGGRKKGQIVEFVATSRNTISVQWGIEQEKVGLIIHRIRLMEAISAKPEVLIYQTGKEIARRFLTVHGTELSCTTGYLFVPLEETEYDFNEKSDVHLTIKLNGNDFYHSADKLRRNYVLFNEKGQESQAKEGANILFCPSTSQLQGIDDYLQLPHLGQLFRLALHESSHVTLDNMEIYLGKECVNSFHHYTSVKPLQGIRGEYSGQEVLLFSQAFLLTISLPKDENDLKYHVVIDKERYSATKMKHNAQGDIVITIPREDDAPHSIRVIDISTQMVKYQFLYSILEGCQWNYSKNTFRYQKDVVEGTLILSDNPQKVQLPVFSALNDMIFQPVGISFSIRLSPPLVYCEMEERNAFTLTEFMWFEDFQRGSVLSLTLPSQFKSRITLGEKEVFSGDGKKFELGNRLYGGGHVQQEEKLQLEWSNGVELNTHLLTTVVFQEKFIKPPITFREEMIYWHYEGNYIGPSHSEFLLSLQLPSGEIHKETLKNKNSDLLKDEFFPLGSYLYQISVEIEELFSAVEEKTIHEDYLITGHPNALKVMDVEFHLTSGNYWDIDEECYKKSFIRYQAALIKNLEYIGESCPNGETAEYPYYRGTLCYVNPYGKLQTFNQGRKAGYEEINPLHLWVVNDYLLILLAETEDGLMMDKFHGTIFNRSPDKHQTYEIPDYFEYESKKEC